ncbi:hypothetical protein KSF_088490 [Reticulibacter mediterranei]|uniref:Uncharacterized protein n=1 Tax=Reticulibacter mediterranei TaxID=2778369 RepID=A0A8J3IQB2_9CHLR|nr:hypothetical protein [Reticulibacter mediterranei]GHO98801.1 hypothetical protein KSF_088490 [Reticulibacter mediterranei]
MGYETVRKPKIEISEASTDQQQLERSHQRDTAKSRETEIRQSQLEMPYKRKSVNSGKPGIELLKSIIADSNQGQLEIPYERKSDDSDKSGIKGETEKELLRELVNQNRETQQEQGASDAFFEGFTATVDAAVNPKKLVSAFVDGLASFFSGGMAEGEMAQSEADMHAFTQEKQNQLGLDLQDRTRDMLVKAYDNQPLDREKRQEVIEEKVLSDREANKDLEKAFVVLQPIIREKAPDNIHIQGDVYGLVVGDHNKVHLTFQEFLKDGGGSPKMKPGASSMKRVKDIRRRTRQDILKRKSHQSLS